MRCSHPRARAVLLVAASAFFSAAEAADTKAPANVIAVQVAGLVTVAHGKSAAPVAVQDNDQLAAGDIVETAPQSGVVLVLPNGSTVSLKEKSRLAITLVLQTPYAAPDLVVYDDTRPEPSTSSTSLELLFGELVTRVRKMIAGSDFTIRTSAGQAGVKGTEFEIAYGEDPNGEVNCRLNTASGLVLFSPVEGAPVEAAAGRQIEVRAHNGKTGVKVRQIQTRNLPAAAKARIQRQNETAGQDVNRTLRRARALRNTPQPPEARPTKPDTDNPAREKPPVPAKPKKPEKPKRPPAS